MSDGRPNVMLLLVHDFSEHFLLLGFLRRIVLILGWQLILVVFFCRVSVEVVH